MNINQLDKLPPPGAIAAYLIVTSALFTLAMGIGFLLLLSYMVQLLFLSVSDIVQMFATFPPMAQFSFLLLILAIAGIWFTRSKRDAHVRKA